MKTEIKSGKLRQEPEYPCLMEADCGTVFLMINPNCGTVLCVGSNQLSWEIGICEPNLKANGMAMLKGTLSLST